MSHREEVPVSIELMLIAGRAVALLVALGFFGWALVQWRLATQRDAQRLFEQMDMLTGEMNALAVAIRTTNERLEQLHLRIDSQSRLTTGAPAPSQRGYEFATRLAKNGASSEDLITSCGISRHEAELLIRLNSTAAEVTKTIAPMPLAKTLATEPAPAPSASSKKQEPTPRRARFAAVG